ncbi:hypothetical protein CRD60_07530 [Bifidobacterium aemilianum]|uniref:ATP-grasp domain-containing protein n=1 Tax=Bifidobacterium aemilianum TaxID=2493120 RepID=A0A366K6L5_9BIFI|nr:hypothetical protein [Bifidobacterium aemilianum]RBP97319.1 hypothetical protein CRD60_07530 [Bifidobacterium aemilianum]
MRAVLHVISPLPWVGQALRKLSDDVEAAGGPGANSREGLGSSTARETMTPWTVIDHNGLEPVGGIGSHAAVWIAPGLLIALNDWRARGSLDPLTMQAPLTDWLPRLPQSLLGRTVINTRVADIRRWKELPASLGPLPWSRICQGRAEDFRAARRDASQLVRDLEAAPDNSLIELSEHLPDITEEWAILVNRGQVQASSGYCLHLPTTTAGGQSIRTVFDGASFQESRKLAAEEAARQLLTANDPGPATILMAFRASSDKPVVLEADPVWCSTPYPFGHSGLGAFAQAIADSRLSPASPSQTGNPGRGLREPSPYQPDPWMVQQFCRRYRGFKPPTHD